MEQERGAVEQALGAVEQDRARAVAAAERRRRLQAVVVSIAFSVAWSLMATAIASSLKKRAEARRGAEAEKG